MESDRYNSVWPTIKDLLDQHGVGNPCYEPVLTKMNQALGDLPEFKLMSHDQKMCYFEQELWYRLFPHYIFPGNMEVLEEQWMHGHLQPVSPSVAQHFPDSIQMLVKEQEQMRKEADAAGQIRAELGLEALEQYRKDLAAHKLQLKMKKQMLRIRATTTMNPKNEDGTWTHEVMLGPHQPIVDAFFSESRPIKYLEMRYNLFLEAEWRDDGCIYVHFELPGVEEWEKNLIGPKVDSVELFLHWWGQTIYDDTELKRSPMGLLRAFAMYTQQHIALQKEAWEAGQEASDEVLFEVAFKDPRPFVSPLTSWMKEIDAAPLLDPRGEIMDVAHRHVQIHPAVLHCAIRTHIGEASDFCLSLIKGMYWWSDEVLAFVPSNQYKAARKLLMRNRGAYRSRSTSCEFHSTARLKAAKELENDESCSRPESRGRSTPHHESDAEKQAAMFIRAQNLKELANQRLLSKNKEKDGNAGTGSMLDSRRQTRRQTRTFGTSSNFSPYASPSPLSRKAGKTLEVEPSATATHTDASGSDGHSEFDLCSGPVNFDAESEMDSSPTPVKRSAPRSGTSRGRRVSNKRQRIESPSPPIPEKRQKDV